MNIGHGSEVTMVVPWNLYDVVESMFKGSKASGSDQFMHVESSLLGLNKDVFLEAKKEVWL